MSEQFERLPTASGAETRRALVALIRPRALAVTGTLLVLIAGTAAGLIGPPVLGRIVDAAESHQPASSITIPILVLLIASVVQGALSALGDSLVAQIGETALADLRERVVDHALRLPLARIEAAGSGDLLARVSGDVAEVALAVRSVLPAVASSALTIVLVIIGLAALDWRFALAGLCAAPIQLYTLRWYLRASGPLYASERIAEGERAQQLLDAIGSAATVRALRLGEMQTDAVAERSRHAIGFTLGAVELRTRFFGRLNVAEFAGLSVILATGFFLLRADAVTIGATTAAALYFHRLFDPINTLLALFDDAQAAAASLSRLVGVAELTPPPGPVAPLEPRDGSIAIHDVRFGYRDGHEVLHGIDLTLPAGRRLALVGTSGAGKTTLMKLVAGIHQPRTGQIELGTAPLERIDPALAHRQIALITQEVHVFAGRLADDLRLIRPDATDKELTAVLELVGALPWVRALPDGLDTFVGDGAYRLTPTEAQQLALARLALKNPLVAVLDEATAEAGSAGARILETAAKRALEGRTALVVAHRLSQSANADVVAVLEDGCLREMGSHDELIAANGPYAALWSAWSSHRSSG